MIEKNDIWKILPLKKLSKTADVSGILPQQPIYLLMGKIVEIEMLLHQTQPAVDNHSLKEFPSFNTIKKIIMKYFLMSGKFR